MNASTRSTTSTFPHNGVAREILPAPALVIHGEADLRPLWNARRIAEMIASADFIAIPGAGHELWRENARDFTAVLRGFLRQA